MARACKSAEATLLKGRTQPYTTTQQPASSQKGRPKRATSAQATAPSLVLAASTVNLRRMARGWLGLGLGLGLGSGLGLGLGFRDLLVRGHEEHRLRVRLG